MVVKFYYYSLYSWKFPPVKTKRMLNTHPDICDHPWPPRLFRFIFASSRLWS